MQADLLTPYELGNKNQTTTWLECINFYKDLAARYPQVLRFEQIGVSDAGVPLHAGIVSADGVFQREQIKRAGRPVFFNNNGIHPGEPEGVDTCMALVRDLCVEPARLAALGRTVLLFVPIYNVDGSLNRADTSRVNQDGPEQFGFRGNSRHLDLNRDFIKCDSLNARVFNQLLSGWDPDVMVDTHTSNGADYPYTMTLIHTQADKLGGELGAFLRGTMLPHIYAEMANSGWPTCPYVNPVKDSPDHGIAEFLEVPRFSTGYAALHHVIGFMPETHMLKPYADRYASMRTLVEVTLAFMVAHAEQIQGLRAAARAAAAQRTHWPVSWKMDEAKPSTWRFRGYAAKYTPSKLGNYTRLSYDRSAPWERDIAYYNNFVADVVVAAPKAYIVPQAWREVIERLQWNGVEMRRIEVASTAQVQVYHIVSVGTRAHAYEGHMFHDEVQLETRSASVQLRPGDYYIPLQQENARYAVETLEPQAHDSFFRWGFFNSVLEKKEAFSDYVFEDLAEQLLDEEPELARRFAAWRAAHPELQADQDKVLHFIFENCQRYAEPEWRRYPVLSIV
ncbi:M14 family zinc carboxypeptidase [Janthinobacterium fluminis]|uniref:M14 family zinc carboxypeptidase n=1 Tax=Janthinobacterium fluminis TaxID=2987524 RepID=A0ABT5K3A9_9BURK|nr:M14 family zinc carboxypeptidase [Janthinobacterium fluminis]MDC8759455.1 M14 family zinc carboxypeptidase [Janthinobacterium fluminis]